MNKTVVIHQPDFLPYLGFFHRFLHADMWIILDSVQFVHSSRSWHNRDKIKTPNGEKWVTVAVQKAARDSKINEIMLSADVDWRKDNLNLISQNYRNAPYYDEIQPYLNALYDFQCNKMIEFNLKSIEIILELFGIRIEKCFASSLNPSGKSNVMLADILRKVGATSYLSGIGAKDYFDSRPFDEAGINVIWQDFKHPVYPQLHGEFIPYLSSIDLLFNCGVEKSRQILRNC